MVTASTGMQNIAHAFPSLGVSTGIVSISKELRGV